MTLQVSIQGKSEAEFRSGIQNLLREGRPDEALSCLRDLLAPLCHPAGILPDRFLSVGPADIELFGWNSLAAKIAALSQGGQTITALGIDFSHPSHFGLRPDSTGSLEPIIETNYYSDSAWPFSTAERGGLVAGCADWGCEWGGSFEDIDDALSVSGMGDLYGAIFLLAERIRSPLSSDEEIQAHLLGACFVATLLHLKVRDHAIQNPPPWKLALIVGSNEDYPFFNAPVFASAELPRPKYPEEPVPTASDTLAVPSASAQSPEQIELLQRMNDHAAKVREVIASGVPLSKAEKGRWIGESLIMAMEMIELQSGPKA